MSPESKETSTHERCLRDAVLAGNTDAWRDLYDGHFRSLYAYVHFRVNRDLHVAEEVVQETWLTAVRRIASFEPGAGTFEAWLRGIADNVLRNLRRRAAVRTSVERPLRADLGPRTARSAAADCAEDDPSDRVGLVLTALPHRYRSVLEAKYREGWPVVRIAAAWDATPKAIESLLSRARAAFRAAYERDDFAASGRLQTDRAGEVET